MDVISFCSDLIRCKSVTPQDDGALNLISNFLSAVGFETRILTFQSDDGRNVVKNLFAEYRNAGDKILGFIGHSDVVPAGEDWEVDPFAAIQKYGYLIGRGVADMKGGIAAFCCAAAQFVRQSFDGTIEIFITGDEEVGSSEGMQSLLKWATESNRIPQYCLIGEPSSDAQLGDRIYLGHRGSLNVEVKSFGKQGHSAYPGGYKNSLAALCKYIAKISDYPWKHEDKRFPKTNLEVTMLFTNNYAANVIPDLSTANLNIRFGADYTVEELKTILEQEAKSFDSAFAFQPSGEAYYCNDEFLKNTLSGAITDIVGINPYFSAAGGTSDGRFMIRHCNIIEFGLPDATIHQKNEKVKLEDLKNLEKIYLLFLKKYFFHDS
ncbi:MAG: succinyl-diaminopimelate desuccinylase [Holosporaceae bacterium]|jgi:succinyl-diaminopimelate desuccinylase|nr:succinyl-diaminopimelate desuccinylase [Holosporaceae bacterium]